MGKSVSTLLNCCFGRDEKVLDKPDVKPKMTPDLMTDTDLIRKTFYHRPSEDLDFSTLDNHEYGTQIKYYVLKNRQYMDI